MSRMKKLVIGVSAAVIGLTSALGASALEWKLSGYDTNKLEREAFNNFRIGIVYTQVDDNGQPTGAVADCTTAEAYGLKPYAVATFSAPMFERAWPNREYVALYADGVNTGVYLYTGMQENLTYRKSGFMWELAAPHRIYQRTQALIYGDWYTDGTYPVEYARDVAKVTAEYTNFYGFGYWRVNDGKIKYMPGDDYKELGAFANLKKYTSNLDENIYAGENWDLIAAGALKPGAVTDLTGKYVKAEDIKIRRTYSLEISGPAFNYDGSVSAGKEYADIYNADLAAEEGIMIKDGKKVVLADPNKTLSDFAVPELVKNVYTYNGSSDYSTVEWVPAGYEKEWPYKYFEVLKVDGVLLDGSKSTDRSCGVVNCCIHVNNYVKPKVYRYIMTPNGSYATANIVAPVLIDSIVK